MRAFISITLTIVGLVGILVGLLNLYSYNNGLAGGIIVLGAGITALCGATIANKAAFTSQSSDGYPSLYSSYREEKEETSKNEQRTFSLSKWLFLICFVAAILLIMLGLIRVFDEPVASIYLMIVSFIGAFYSAIFALELHERKE